MKLLAPPILLRILCSVLLPVSVFSQVVGTYCNNTAMVPVFKQDFGQGSLSTSTSIAPAGSTNYNFGNVGTDGNYIITPFVQNANKADWAKGSDHTGNANGNMFLVNAGGSNSIFFQQNVPGLCAGSNYNFTAWIANVNSPNTQGVCGSGLVYPKIKFNIKDTSNILLATYTTILIPLSPVNGPLNWQKYGFQFAMPSYTGELKLEIIDAWGGGPACGNDVAIDDILFEACVPKITVALTSSSNNVCLGGIANLQSTLTNNPYTNPYYLWQKSIDGGTVWNNIGTPGIGLNSYNITNAVTTDGGLYRVQVAPTTLSVLNATCSAVSNGVMFTVNPLPKLNPTSNAPICSGSDLLLKANASAGSGVYSSYQWKGPVSFQSSSADTSIIAVKTTASGLYTVQVTDSKGCSDSTGLVINIDSTPILSIQSISDTICSGGLSKLTLNSSLPNSKFFWNNAFVNGSIAGNISVANPELTGSFSSTINNNGTSIGKIRYRIYAQSIANCKSNTIDTIVSILPTLSLANAGTDITICSGTSIALNAINPTVGLGTWKQISGPSIASFADSTKSNTVVTNLVPGNYLFSWSVGNKCATNTDTVALNYTPKPVPSYSLLDTIVCGPASIVFTNNTPNKNNYTFSWNFGNGITSSLANPLPVNFLASSTGLDTIYTIVLKAISKCDTVTYTGSIKVKRKALAQFTVSPQNTCLPLITTIRNESTGLNTNYTILFGDGKDSVIQQNSNFNYTYFGNKTQLFQPLLLATNSCGTDTAFASVQAIANQLKLNTTIKDTAVCGAPFTYSVSDNSSGGSSYEWNWGDGNSSITKTAINQQHTYLQAGIYTVKQQIKHLCGDTSISKLIQIYPSIKASMLAIPSNQCIGDSILFSGFGDSTANYQWTINDSIYSTQSTFKLPFVIAGNYQSQLSITKLYSGKTCSDKLNTSFSIVSTKSGKATINPLSSNCVPINVRLINQTNQTISTTWDMGDGNSITGDTTDYTYVLPGIYTIKMFAKNAGGCAFVDSATIQIKSPKGKINFKSGLYCNSNNIVQFIPSVIDTDLIEYDFGDGNKMTANNTRSVQHQYAKPGIYFPSFTLISKAGCRIPLTTKDSIVIENVKAGFSVNTIFNCGITSFDFQDSSSSLSGINQYTWMLNKVKFANSKNASIDFKQTGTHETSLYVTSNWGCTDSISGSYKVSIYSFPQVNINSINEACLNNLMELKSEISSIDSIIYRVWNLGNGSKVNDSTVKILYFDEGKYTVKLTAATINKCYDSAFKQLTIHPVPTIKIASNNRVCNGDSLILKADGAINYVWKDQQDNIICNNCLSVKVRPQRSTEYKVIGYNEYGCTQVAATSVQVINKTPISVAPESVICEGSSIRIWASGGNSYQWLPANGLNNYNSASPIVNPRTTTTYKVIAKDAYNCFVDTGYIKVIVGKPTPIKIGKDSSFVAGTKIQLKATAQQNDIMKWKWSGGADLSCVACSDPIAKIVNDETIVCTATNQYGCISADTIRFKTFCPNTEVFIPNAFTPDGDGVNDQLFVQARGISMVKSMRIYSRWGELVFEKLNFLPNDKGLGWNGRVRGVLANPDVYVYLCEVVCEKGAVQLLKGNVAILK